jgi:hypothetical protein
MRSNFRTLDGLYDAKADNAPVIAITGTTYSDLMNSSYEQDVNLIRLYSNVTAYNSMSFWSGNNSCIDGTGKSAENQNNR